MLHFVRECNLVLNLLFVPIVVIAEYNYYYYYGIVYLKLTYFKRTYTFFELTFKKVSDTDELEWQCAFKRESLLRVYHFDM